MDSSLSHILDSLGSETSDTTDSAQVGVDGALAPGPTEPLPQQQPLAGLEAQLREKEQLVAALTERLEQAAEQLDRVHRTGADRGLRVGGSLPPEVIEQQTELTGSLQEAVDQWQSLQAEAVLGRLDDRVSELQDLLAELTTAQVSPLQNARLTPVETEPPALQSDATDTAADESPSSGWESLKSEYLQDDAQAGPATTTVKSTQQPPVQEAAAIAPVDPPHLIDVETANVEQLQEAVSRRDAYISYLLKRLKTTDSIAGWPLDWHSSESIPEDLTRRLRDLEELLEEKLRLAEVDHSLERARMGREESKLKQKADQIEKEIKRLSLIGEEADSEASENSGKDGGRWLKFLSRRQSDSSTE